jgi:hypothetical protein
MLSPGQVSLTVSTAVPGPPGHWGHKSYSPEARHDDRLPTPLGSILTGDELGGISNLPVSVWTQAWLLGVIYTDQREAG